MKTLSLALDSISFWLQHTTTTNDNNLVSSDDVSWFFSKFSETYFINYSTTIYKSIIYEYN